MNDVQIYLAALVKMLWLWLPVILLILLWGVYEAIENKW